MVVAIGSSLLIMGTKLGEKPGARHAVWLPMWAALLGLLVIALLLAIARPAAQIFSPLIGPDSIEQNLSELLSGEGAPHPAGEDIRLGDVRTFYGARQFRAAWTEGGAETATAEVALSVIRRAAEEGLDPAEYHVAELRLPEPNAPAAARAQFDLLLTDGVLRYAHDLRMGRLSPGSVDSDIGLPVSAFDAVGGLGAALSSGTLAEWLGQLPPPHPEYARLKAALRTYRKIAAYGGWQALPAAIDMKQASADPRRALLIARLAIEDPALAAPADTADEDVIVAAIFTAAQHDESI